MKALRLILPAATVLVAFFASSVFVNATPAFSKKEGNKPCTTCHEKGAKPTKDAPKLTNVGLYYKEKKTLEGAPAPK